MKCQILFSGKNKKNSISLSFSEFDHSMVNIKKYNYSISKVFPKLFKSIRLYLPAHF